MGLQSVHSLTIDLAVALSVTKPDLLERVFPSYEDSTNPNHHIKTAQETNTPDVPVQEMNNLRLSLDMKQDCITSNHGNLGSDTNIPVLGNNNHDGGTDSIHRSDAGCNIQDSMCHRSKTEPSLVQSLSLLDSFVHLWKMETRGKVIVAAFLCPRNVILASSRQNIQVSK